MMKITEGDTRGGKGAYRREVPQESRLTKSTPPEVKKKVRMTSLVKSRNRLCRIPYYYTPGGEE